MHLEIPKHRLRLIDFNYFFKTVVEEKIVTDLRAFNILTSKIEATTRRFFYHHIIHELCEFLLNSATANKTVIYFDRNGLHDLSLYGVFAEEDVKVLISSALNKIKIKLPIRVYSSDYSLEYFYHCFTKNEGKAAGVINELCTLRDASMEKFLFCKVRDFTEKQGLTFLNGVYFKQLKTKMLLMT